MPQWDSVLAPSSLVVNVLGYGKLFDITKTDAVPVFVGGVKSKNLAYQSNLLRCKKVKIENQDELVPSFEKYQDSVYYSLLARLAQVNLKRKAPVSDDEKVEKRRQPTQVIYLTRVFFIQLNPTFSV